MNRRIFMLLSMLFFLISTKSVVSAGTYDNAYTYYQKYGGSNSEPARLNKSDGCIYFVSAGSTAKSNVCYRTVGYTMTICVDGKKDSVEVKLDGKYIKTVSTVKKNGYTYVLRKVNFNKLKLLFNGNKNITWNKIFVYKNTYRFDAIMTVVENEKKLCGAVYESTDYRKITADNNSYLFRTAKAIKNARNWANPSDLDNFYDKYILFEPVESIEAKKLKVSGSDNIYYSDDTYYVRKGSDIKVSVESVLKNTESADVNYQPNFNMVKVSGWGNDQVFTMSKKASGAQCVSGLIKESGKQSSPLSLKGTVKSMCNGTQDSIIDFKSGSKYTYNVADGYCVNLVPEARVYYKQIYPERLSDETNLCEANVNIGQKKKLMSDGIGPEITVVSKLSGYGYVSVPYTIKDNGSGIRFVELYCDDGSLLLSKNYTSGRTTCVCSSEDDTIIAEKGKNYYIKACDNVGNITISNTFSFSVPTAHIIEHTLVRGFNGFNVENALVNVYGGNSEIASLLIMSEEEDNPTNSRIVFANQDVSNKTLLPNQLSLTYQYNPMDKIKGLKDGTYWVDVISGGRYVSSEPKRYYIHKDTTPLTIKFDVPFTYGGWMGGNSKVTIDAKDNYSGIYSVDAVCDGEILSGTKKQSYIAGPINAQYILTKDGINTIDFQAYDMAYNYSSYKKVFKIDSIKPEISLSDEFVGTDIEKDRWINSASLDGKAVISDSLSGFSNDNNFTVYRCINSSTNEVDKSNYDISYIDKNNVEISFTPEYCKSLKSAKYRFMYEAYDLVGNRAIKNIYLNIDKEAPYIEPLVEDAWDISTNSGNICAKDDLSGIDSVQLMIDDVIVNGVYGIGQNEYTMYCDLSKAYLSGKYAHVYVTDVAGNTYDYPLPTLSVNEELNVSAKIVSPDNDGAPEFESGDLAQLQYSAWAYADCIEIIFPKGLEQYNAKITITNPAYTISDTMEFIIPDKYEGEYSVQVKAYREGDSCNGNAQFCVTNNTALNIRTRIRR